MNLRELCRRLSRRPLVMLITFPVAYILCVLALGWITGKWSETIYFLTGAILVWYTVETHVLRKETTRQTELAVRPAILARIQDNPHALILRNIGNGPALYVKVEDIEFEIVDYATGRRAGRPDFVATFDTTVVIEAKADVPATVQLVRYIGHGTEPVFAFLSALDPRYQKHLDLPVLIHYQDLNGGLHRTRLQMGKGGTQFIRFESGGSR